MYMYMYVYRYRYILGIRIRIRMRMYRYMYIAYLFVFVSRCLKAFSPRPLGPENLASMKLAGKVDLRRLSSDPWEQSMHFLGLMVM